MTGSPRLSSAPAQQPSRLSRVVDAVSSKISTAARISAAAALTIIAACADSGTTEPAPGPTSTTSNPTPTVPAGKSEYYDPNMDCSYVATPKCPNYKSEPFNAVTCDVDKSGTIDQGETTCLEQ